jgi:hypothetical protein
VPCGGKRLDVRRLAVLKEFRKTGPKLAQRRRGNLPDQFTGNAIILKRRSGYST